MLESNRLVPRRSSHRTTPPRDALPSPWPLCLTLLLLIAGLAASKARACTDDKDCKGERICDHSVCKTPRVALAEPAPVAAPASAPSPAPAPAAPLVMVEPAPPPQLPATAQHDPSSPPVSPPPLVMVESPPAAQPAVVVTTPAEPPPPGDGSYAPAAGFRCLLGDATCAFQLRPLEVNWTHVDLHGDVLLGGLTGGDLGIGAGTRHWQLGGPSSPYGMVVRWDNDLVVVSNNPAGVALVTVGLDTGPRVGFSFAVSRELALEATVNGGLFFGYGVATGGGVNQWTLSGYTGVLLGARM
jgi:hypothetical protein